MITSTQRPWEKVGAIVPVEGRLRTNEALRLTNTDWAVEKISVISAPEIVYLKDEAGNNLLDVDGSPLKDPDVSENSDLFGIKNPQMCMTIREDTRSYLGTVGKGYKVVQNTEFATFFDEALGKGAAAITAVGTLGRYGSRVFMIATLPEMLEILPSEPIERHILLTTTHDGTGPIEALFLAWNMNRDIMIHAPGGRVSIRHTKNASKRLETSHKVLCRSEDYWNRVKRSFAYMSKRDANDSRVREFVEAMFPDIVKRDDEGNVIDRKTSHQAAKARESLQEIYSSKNLPATDWGLYNSVAYFVDHERKLAKSQRSNGISRWEVSVFGAGSSLRDRAYRWLTRSR